MCIRDSTGTSRVLTAYATTDKEGRFEARVIPGKIGVLVNSVKKGHVPAYHFEQKWSSEWPQGKRVLVPNGVTTFNLPVIRFLETRPISGVLVDAGGKPVPNTGVYALRRPQPGSDYARTDAEGRFTFRRFPAVYKPSVYQVGRDKREDARILSLDPLRLQMK